MEPIRKSFAAQKEQLEKNFIKKQADLIKKIPAGDRLDKSLQNLKEIRDKNRTALDDAEMVPLAEGSVGQHRRVLAG